MSLSVPTLAEWLDHADLPSVENERLVERLLQTATDLLQVHSGVEEEPAAGTLASRIAQEAKLALAHALYVRSPDREAALSSFASERLGSFSYTKASRDILQQGFPTGVWLYDTGVIYLRGELSDEMLREVWGTSSKVFLPEVESWEPTPPWHGEWPAVSRG